MAYRDSVNYIEQMDPPLVTAVADECAGTSATIRSALPALAALPGRIEWRSDARDLCDQRLREVTDLAEGLHDGFQRAAAAVADYAAAQVRAKELVAEAATAEQALGALIAGVVATQSPVVRWSDPLRQWHDLRSITGFTDLLAEWGQRDAIDRIRGEAESLFNRATVAYDDAIRVESEARADTVDRLRSAYRMLPDLLADSALSAAIVQAAPGLTDTGGGKYHIGPPTPPSLTFDNDFPYDPNASPTAADYASWNAWTLKLRAAQAARPDLDDATGAYAHYLEGLGTDLRVDYEEAYAEDDALRRAVDNEIQSAQQEAERIARETGQAAFQMTGQPTSAAELASGYPTATENWQKTLGDHTIYGTSDVVVTGDTITMTIRVHAEDMYNFNAGAADIASGAPDDENGRFSTLGWAKEFRTHGELERTVTWTIGDTSTGAVAGGAGAERHAPGEDRADGRSDG